jgi:crossover junction endodeoxyribonuclease RuvC
MAFDGCVDMVIMGIDPGLNATGYGFVVATPDRLRMIVAGAIRPPARQPLARRLALLYDELTRLVIAHHPETMVLEALYVHHQYLTTAALMAHARGVACLISAQHKLPLVEYLPTRVKKALTGSGSASKEQVARMVGTWLGVEDPSLSADATDALALAVAHAHINIAKQHLFARPASASHQLVETQVGG